MSKGTNHSRKKTYFVETDLQMRPTNSHEIHLSTTNTFPKSPIMLEKRPMCTKWDLQMRPTTCKNTYVSIPNTSQKRSTMHEKRPTLSKGNPQMRLLSSHKMYLRTTSTSQQRLKCTKRDLHVRKETGTWDSQNFSWHQSWWEPWFSLWQKRPINVSKDTYKRDLRTCSWCSLKNIADFFVGSVIPSHFPSNGMPGDVSSAYNVYIHICTHTIIHKYTYICMYIPPLSQQRNAG